MLITWYITITMMYILAWYPHYYHINPYVTSGFTAGCPDAMGFRRSSLCHSGHGRSTPAQYLSQVPDGGRWGLGFCWDFLHVFFCGVLTYPPVIKHGLLENPPFIHDFFQVDLASSPMWWKQKWTPPIFGVGRLKSGVGYCWVNPAVGKCIGFLRQDYIDFIGKQNMKGNELNFWNNMPHQYHYWGLTWVFRLWHCLFGGHILADDAHIVLHFLAMSNFCSRCSSRWLHVLAYRWCDILHIFFHFVGCQSW